MRRSISLLTIATHPRMMAALTATVAGCLAMLMAYFVGLVGASPAGAAGTTYTIKDLGTLGGSYSSASDVNDSGQVVGGARTSSGIYGHAFLYSGGQMQDLGTLGGYESGAYGINDSGQVVGQAGHLTSSHAFLYADGQMQDLNDLIPAGSGWELTNATEINTSGQIVGEGELHGNMRAFLGTPTQAPRVTSTSPKANSTAVDPATIVTATFSEEMDASSINPTTFQLFRKNSRKEVAASVHYEAATHTATLDPTHSLQKGVSYNAVVSTGTKDLEGNPLEQQHGWSFTVSK